MADGDPFSSSGGPSALYVLLLLPGAILGLLALIRYPPLDYRPPMALIMTMFFVPITLYFWSFVRKGPGGGAARWRMFMWSGLALLLLGVVLLANGGLDRAPAHEVRPTVISKAVIRGRNGNQCILVVSSWRPGRDQEKLTVGTRVFERAVVGETIRVELHQGLFGLPWRESISAQ